VSPTWPPHVAASVSAHRLKPPSASLRSLHRSPPLSAPVSTNIVTSLPTAAHCTGVLLHTGRHRTHPFLSPQGAAPSTAAERRIRLLCWTEPVGLCRFLAVFPLVPTTAAHPLYSFVRMASQLELIATVAHATMPCRLPHLEHR
jgi:hypothetical protein